jgi:hypothetical protein
MHAMQEVMHDDGPLAANHGFGYVEQKAMQDVLEKGPNEETKSYETQHERERKIKR